MAQLEGARSAWLDRFQPQPASPHSPRLRGLVKAAIGTGVGVLVYWAWSPLWGMLAVGLSGVLGTAALLSPDGIYTRLEVGMAFVGRLIARAVGWVLLAPFFYLVVTPLGLLLRAVRRDPLQLRSSQDVTSYWSVPDHDRSEDSYRRQF